VYINIKFPEEIIDTTAHKLGTATTLCFMNTHLFIKAPYDNNNKHCFLKFDADERVEAIESYLQQEIDFAYYKSQGIIQDAYSLHKGNQIERIQVEMRQQKYKLIFSFFSDKKYIKYMQPINMIKNYYGEKHAFEISFLLHYECWLMVPALVGFFASFKIAYNFFEGDNTKDVFDTSYNGFFGIFLSIWATLFFESWKGKQETIQYLWHVDESAYSEQDERDEEFVHF
jgi:hypothetical protein